MALYWRRQVGNQPIYSTQGQLQLVGDGRKAVRKTFRQEVAKGQYDVRIKRTTADSTSDRSNTDTSLLGVKFFQEMPADTAGQTRVSMTLKATGQLNGAVDRYSSLASAASVVPGLGSTPIHTSNPAAWFYLIAKGIYHPTSGRLLAGAGLPDSKIDLDALEAWAQFCETNGLMCNAIFSEKISVADALTKVAKVGRAAYSYHSGKLGVVWDAPNQPPVAMFGPHNMLPGTFSISYSSEKLADEIVVRFENEEKDYESETIRVAVPGAGSTGQNPAEVDLWGVTNKVQAGKEANLLAAAQLWRRRRISWETDLEGLIVTRGDVVLLSHDLTSWGASGRFFAAVSTTNVTLDKQVTGDGTQQWLAFRRPDSEGITYHKVTPFVGAADTLTLVDPLPAAPGADGNHPAADYVWTFGATATPGKKVKITSIVPSDENRVQITAVDENPEYYASENDLYTYVPRTPVVGTLPSIFNLKVVAANDPTDHSQQLFAYASWEVVGPNFSEAHVYAKTASGAFEFKGSTKENYLSFPVDPTQVYTVKVIVYGELGTLGGGNFLTYVWQASSVPPPEVMNLASETGSTVTAGQDMRILWDPSPLTTHYEVTITAGAFSKAITTVDTRFVYSAEDARLDGGPWRSVTFSVRAGNVFGYSAPKSITLTNPAPAALSGLSLQSSLDLAVLSFTRPSDADYAGVLAWMSTTQGFTPGPANLVYDGNDTSVTLRLANPALTYYVRAAAYDTFGKDALNLSSELSVTGSLIDHADLASSFENELQNYSAQQTLKLSNGAVAGYGLASSSPDADAQTSAFVIQADKLGIVKPSSGAASITTISRSGNVVTANTQAAHNLAIGTSVVVSGVANTGFNGTFLITAVPSSTQLRWSQTAANASSSGGTLKAVPLIPFIFDTTVDPPVLSIDGYISASRMRAGTFQAVTNVGSTKVLIDGPGERISVNDGTRDRVKLGKLGTGNYGLEVIDAAGNTVLSNDGRLGSTLYIGSGTQTLAELAENAALPTMQFIGEFASAPSPSSYSENSVYRNSSDGNSYVLKSGAWTLFLQKGADGADGAPGTAKLLDLNSSSQVFQVSKAGVGSPSSVTLTAAQQNLSGSPTFTVVSGTATLTGGPGATRTLAYADMSTDVVTVEVSWDGLTDTITIVKVREGQDGSNGAPAVVGLLTNEAQTLAAASDGTVGDFSSATTYMKMYVGATDDSANWSYSKVDGAGVTSSINNTVGHADRGKLAVSAMSVDSGYVDISAAKSGQPTVTKRFSLSKSRAGANGATGLNSATVMLFRRAASAPALPSTTATYTFSTGVLTGHNNSWTQTVPAADGNPLWMTLATASGTSTTDTIASGEWAAVAKIAQDGATGSPGTNGLNTAVVTLYKRGAAAPAAPSGTFTYTFATGVLSGGTPNGWTQAVPATDGNPLWAIQASAVGSSTTDTIAAAEFSSPTKIVQDGATGVKGDTGATGARGSITAYISGQTAWSDTVANNYFTTNYSGVKVLNDVVTQYGTGFSQTRFWNGSAWTQITVAIDGSLLVSGTVGASALSVTNLAAINATLGNVHSGSVRGGDYASYAWPAYGQSGFYLGPEGLLFGNANGGANGYFQVTAAGALYAPGFSIVGGVITISQANVINTLNVAGNAITASGANVYTNVVNDGVPPSQPPSDSGW